MSEQAERVQTFVSYANRLKGDEKGEAQVFCDRLFQAFGHAGYKEAGATLEARVRRRGRSTQFADLLWRPRLLIEMKKRGELLQKHYRQAFEYWIELVPDRPRYVVLCNFDEFWIFDFNTQLDEPVDRLTVAELPDRYTAFNFLFPDEREPQFGNDRVAVTRAAADKVAEVFNSLVERGEAREPAQRFILQCVVAMFSEDFDLLPKGLFTQLLDDCRSGRSTYDLLGGLFQQMNSRKPAKAGRYQDVAYFNGGLFETIEPLELNADETLALLAASNENWSKVAPPIFGTLFQSSMDQERRHAFGAHFTHEADIQKIVLPTIVRPWRERIAKTSTLQDLIALSKELLNVRVLDPACGSGNFLYIAYRELVNLEMEVLAKIYESFGQKATRSVGTASLVSTTQFFGLDKDPFAVELAKVTVMLGKRIALAETHDSWFAAGNRLPFTFEDPLPLDNLDKNIRCADALFTEWPAADVIIGNPPYQSKNKMQQEYGRAYLNRLRDQFPDVPGRADYCVYWFRKAHDELSDGDRAGLVGTNTIRQNYSREGGLDYIVNNGGTITEAVSTQVWSGDAVVHVSLVNWVKGRDKGSKMLFRQLGDNLDSPWEAVELDRISAALSGSFDITTAAVLRANKDSDTCDQGQTHGHKGFLVSPEEASHLIDKSPRNREVILPYLTADEMLGCKPPLPQRYVIDFHPRDLLASQMYREPFERVRAEVLPTRKNSFQEEEDRNAEALADNPRARVNHHHKNFLNKWWLLSYARERMIKAIARLKRYIVCGQVTKRPVFEFVSPTIRPNAALMVFGFEDDYSFGVLQSGTHWLWFTERCSTLKGDFRYTTSTVYDSFPWPQSPTVAQIRKVAQSAKKVRTLRTQLLHDHGLSLRELYRTLELPGDSPLKTAHATLDEAVRGAYGMRSNANALEFLFSLNQDLAEKEASMHAITGPGLPSNVRNASEFVSEDCIQMP